MNILCCNFAEFHNRIEASGKKIVLYGAGVVGRVAVPEILKQLNLLSYIDCYVDNNQSIWGSYISIGGIAVEVKPPSILADCTRDSVLLLNISRFSDALTQLEAMPEMDGLDCYIMPMMLIHNFCMGTTKGNAVTTTVPLIPKKIHYMWLGGKQIPTNLQKCIDSWKRYCPDYEIIQWNEDNYDIYKHPYMKQAYEAKAYGLLPDYARLDILYREGGIYLDTDVELRRNLDDMLCQEAFCGVEKWQTLNFGGLSGAVKGHPMIKAFLDARADILFIDSNGRENRNTCGFYDTPVAIAAGYRLNGETQCVNGMNIYAYDYFHPYDYMSGLVNETEHTHSVHWFNGGWLDENQRTANEHTKGEYMRLYGDACSDFKQELKKSLFL